MDDHYDYGGGGPRVEKYKRYLVMGLKNGELHHIIARRGHTPDDIINRALGFFEGSPHAFERLYIVEVGDEGTFGSSTNLKLQEIVPPPPTVPWLLKHVKGLYG